MWQLTITDTLKRPAIKKTTLNSAVHMIEPPVHIPEPKVICELSEIKASDVGEVNV